MLRDSDDLDTPIVMRMSDNPSVDFDFVAKMLSKKAIVILTIIFQMITNAIVCYLCSCWELRGWKKPAVQHVSQPIMLRSPIGRL